MVHLSSRHSRTEGEDAVSGNREPRELYLRFQGRILDALGIQMYQSPTAAIAELIANAWDADAEKVEVVLPPRSQRRRGYHRGRLRRTRHDLRRVSG